MAKSFEIMEEFEERGGRGSRREDEDYMLEKAFKEGCEHGYKKAMREAGFDERGMRGSYREGFEEKIEKLNNDYAALYNEIMANENMSAYQKAQQELEALANEINSILAMSLNGEDPLTCDPNAQDCTHDCSTCGGHCGH